MDLKLLGDTDLLTAVKKLAHHERDTLTQILHHLREIERRRLYCDLGYSSLFDYAVKELQFSEGQAGRRLQAMRLIKEIPEVEQKIASGQLNLSNVARAQSFFREVAKSKPNVVLKTSEKLNILKKLENKSSRQGEAELIKLLPEGAPHKPRERMLSEDHTEIKFVMGKDLKAKLDEVRSLAGPRGASMDFKELVEFMAAISTKELRAKKFGKKASQTIHSAPVATPAQDPLKTSTNIRYIPKPLHRFIYQRDHHKCINCGSKTKLNIDHIIPLSRNGKTTAENLRLLCFDCNQRAGIKILGLAVMEKWRETTKQ